MQIQPTLSQSSSMVNLRKKSSSGESFSFPSTPNQDSDFEFGSLAPDSPTSFPCRTSPADHLFFNGRLLPHSFPIFQQHHHAAVLDNPRVATSGTSSISSKESLVSSRSNSTNSSCSSARTSSSDVSERRLFHSKMVSSSYGKGTSSSMGKDRYQAYGCSQRWQHITPVPALNRDASRRRRGDHQQGRKKEGTKKQTRRVRLRFGRRVLRWFVMACKQCHAIEPSKANKETAC